MKMLPGALLVFALALCLVPVAAAQAACGQGTNPACNPLSVLTFTAPTTNADGTPLTDLAGYLGVICPATTPATPCTQTSPGAIVRDLGKPTAPCTNGLGVVFQPPCAAIGPFNVPTAGLKTTTAYAYDTATPRNVSVPAVTSAPFSYVLTLPPPPDLLPPSAPSTPTVQ